MTRRRWMADEVSGNSAALTGDNARHLAQVLRAKVGEQFDVAADGQVRLATVTRVGDDRVEFSLGEEVPARSRAWQVTMLIAIFKFDRMEWAIEKATELGVTEIVPVIARRTDAHLASAAAKRVERWRKIAKEGAQQSRRVDVPEIAEPVKLKAALQSLNDGMRIVLAETEKSRSLAELLRDSVPVAVTLAIGPEGGWTPDELKIFAENGWKSASLGSTILRSETAAVATLAIVSAFSTESQ
jgi:16S rRNA (uracil1498-N3)-methyltransferase